MMVLMVVVMMMMRVVVLMVVRVRYAVIGDGTGQVQPIG